MSTTEQEQAIPSSDDSKIIFFGMSVLLVVFGLFGGWMAMAPLSSAAVSVGKVSADLNQKRIQHLEGGIVSTIYVQNGDLVQKGDKLLKFENPNIIAQNDILYNQYIEALATESRLESLRDDKTEMELSLHLKEKQDDPVIAKIIDDQRRAFILKLKMIENDKLITAQRVSQLNKQLDGVRSVMNSKQSRLESIQEEIEEWKILFKEKLVDKLRLRELQREEALIEGDIASSMANLSQISEQTSEIRAQYLLREKEIQEKTLSELVSIKLNVSELRLKMVAAQDSVDRMLIRAPISGTVVGMEIHTEGAVVAPGMLIMEIVPENSKLIAIVQVQTKDIDKVHVGLLSDVRFSAFDLRQTHVIEGRVIHVSADSKIDEVTGVPFYETKIEVTADGEKDLERYGFILVAGMPVEVMIKIGDRTALDYFIKPFVDMLSRSFTEE